MPPTITGMSDHTPKSDVLLVVPTLGRRSKFLRQALQSIRSQSVAADIVIVAPDEADEVRSIAAEFGAMQVPDPGGLPEAINLGVAEGLSDHAYVGWLNDDDLLEPDSLTATRHLLQSHSSAVVAFGACRYIDEDGHELWVSRAGSWAPRILKWGPDLVPQPGMLVRANAWQRVGGLNTAFRMAFDLDLLLRLQAHGRLAYTGTVVSSFRWHQDSLTVDNRATNLAESARAKRAAMGPLMRKFSWLWEPAVHLSISVAATRVNRRAKALSSAR